MAKKKSQKSLKRWGEQDWDYVSEKDKKKPKKKRGRYLPKSVRRSLTPGQKAATNRKKRKAGGVGSRAKYSKKVAKKVSSVSKLIKYVNIQKDISDDIQERYEQRLKEGYSSTDANRLAYPDARTYDDPTAPPAAAYLPSFITDRLGKLVGGRDKATREKSARIYREQASQKVDQDTGGYTKRYMRNKYFGDQGPTYVPMQRRFRSDAPVPDWAGYAAKPKVNI